MRLTRRALLRLTLAAAASATGLSRSFLRALAAAGAGPREVCLYDLSHVADAHAHAGGRVAAYDEMHLVATLQGIVNRVAPRLLVRLTPDVDDYWLSVLQSPGNLLDGVVLRPVTSLDDLISIFAPSIAGAVVWDPRVPATSNVASTVAGVEDLVAIRYDLGVGSLFMRYILMSSLAGAGIPAIRWLVHPDGSSLFAGHGTIPQSDEPSTGSAKCDAYAWARRTYLDTGRCDPTALGYYLDAWFLSGPDAAMRDSDLSNHDYLVARRGFVFDLSVWDDEAPVDDPGQRPGTDLRTLRGILASAHRGAGGAFTTIHGFPPWTSKYSDATPRGAGGGRHRPVPTENRLVSVATQYNACLDADAPGGACMANASLFQHGRRRERYVQAPVPTPADLQARGLLDATGRVVPRHHIAFYAGDYDSAAWLYEAMPRVWSDGARGSVPITWGIDPNLERRAASLLDHLWRTRSEHDTFAGGDSGAGYVNPGLLEEPRPLSGLPSAMDAWAERCRSAYERWGISVTGFVIDGEARPLSPAGQRAYAGFSPTGIGMQSLDPPVALRAGVPLLRMAASLPTTGNAAADVASAAGVIAGSLRPDLLAPPPAPTFSWFRTVLQPPSFHASVVDLLRRTYPEAQITVVDAHTLFALLRQHLAGSVFLRTPPDPQVDRGGDRVTVEVANYTSEPVDGVLSVEVPRGWRARARAPFHLAVEDRTSQPLVVLPPRAARHGPAATAVLTAVATYGGRSSRHPFTVTLLPG